MPRKLTIDEVNSVLEPRGIILIGEYKNGSTKTLFGCKYGHTWDAKFQDVKNSRSGCPHCAGTRRRTPEQINSSLGSRGILLVGEYINNKTKATFRCKYGHEWSSRPDNVVTRGSGCPHCVYSRLNTTKLYIMGSSEGTKIGISKDPEIRRRKISTESGISDLYVAEIFEVESYEQGLKYETLVHKILKERKIIGLPEFSGHTEFFNISVEEAKAIVNNVMEGV